MMFLIFEIRDLSDGRMSEGHGPTERARKGQSWNNLHN